MKYLCCTENRRSRVRAQATLNGLDYLEIVDERQLNGQWVVTLVLYFIHPLPGGVADTDVVIEISGGERIRQFEITDQAIDAADRRIFRATIIPMGDFSQYLLQVLSVGAVPMDPRLSAIEFSFVVNCPSDFDCLQTVNCESEAIAPPDINYLARDYTSFRQVILDRLAVTNPQWDEQSAADLNMALVEVLAFVGDYQSYVQDTKASEAYIDTAISRVSVKRHARLVNYSMHDGCSARSWVQVSVAADGVDLPAGTQFLTRVAAARTDTRIEPASAALEMAMTERPVVFESLYGLRAYGDHNRMQCYTWGEDNCCLARGATGATLLGHKPNLRCGDILVFEEIRGANTLKAADANPQRRQAVRLAQVLLTTDPLDNIDVTEISWLPEDALSEAFCLRMADDTSDNPLVEPVTTIVLGNVVLADHGATVSDDIIYDGELAQVPAPFIMLSQGNTALCEDAGAEYLPARFRPRLAQSPISQTVAFPREELFTLSFQPAWQAALDAHSLPVSLDQAMRARGIALQASASITGSLGRWSVSDGGNRLLLERDANLLRVRSVSVPAIRLRHIEVTDAQAAITSVTSHLDGDTQFWTLQRDLLSSDARDQDYVVEIENDGSAFLRFGDDQFGERPTPGSSFSATYRVGVGVDGNIGADTLVHVVSGDTGIVGVRNPLAAAGGVLPESAEEVRREAPFAYRNQARAVTPEDYAQFVSRHPLVQGAIASLRWTGSWYTIFLTVDPVAGVLLTAELETELREFLEPVRMAGHDLEIDAPLYIALELDLKICVDPHNFRSEVKQAVLEVLNNQRHADGSLGVFHPDRLSFGQSVYLSPIYHEVQAIEGVSSVEVITFQRQGQAASSGLEDQRLEFSRAEIPRLDNDPNFPERGVLRLTMIGGK